IQRLEQRVLLSASDLDPTFGSAGILSDSSVTNFAQIVPLADGRIVALEHVTVRDSAGQSNLERLLSDGKPDPSFSAVTASDTFWSTMVVQPDGKIIVSGFSAIGNETSAVARYSSNGTPDSSFDGDGKASYSFFDN